MYIEVKHDKLLLLVEEACELMVTEGNLFCESTTFLFSIFRKVQNGLVPVRCSL
jgi:hypothetical protein